MNTKKTIKVLAAKQGVTMTDLAQRVGITRQALYHRLDHQIKFESFNELLEAMGIELGYAKDGHFVKLKSLEK